ncbi:MAG: acyl-CoA carboxylase subunit beta [Actinomycetota bacterium]
MGPEEPRPEFEELLERRAAMSDEARTEAVQKRRARGRRTARENVADLCDKGTFVEYGALAVAAQRSRRSIEDLVAKTPADGLIGGIGKIEGRPCAVLSYDYTVLAGTQGAVNHRKKDRLFDVIARLKLPVVLFAEGGGGRPGDTDVPTVSGLDTMAFALFARLSGLVPSIGVASGYCFAGNAALLGCCDLIIATADANIGMGGPAMIEAGGLGAHPPEEIGPAPMHARTGSVDVLVADDAEAVTTAKTLLSYFGDRAGSWDESDQAILRTAVPEHRRTAYDPRPVIETIADPGSVTELRREFGRTIVTGLARVEGRPVGIFANDSRRLGGAIDSEGADKAARFMALCDAHGLPIVSLCDTPGFMVGPKAEETAQVRHFARMFVTGASVTVPYITVVLRKGYGLGAQAMAGGSFHAPLLTVSWPTGEFGGMNLEGAVRLGFRKELDSIEDPTDRENAFEAMVAEAYQRGKALNLASHFEIDDVIDPADTRGVIADMLASCPPRPIRDGKKRPLVDPW